MWDRTLKDSDYSIRPIEENDLKTLLEWRNSDRIHSLMLTEHRITWEEHYSWFKKISKYSPKRNFIVEYKKNPIGYLGYTNFDEKNKSCSPGSYIGDTNITIPVDAGLYMAYYILEYGFQVLKMEKFISEVLEANKRVLKLNKLLGYKIVGRKKINNKIFILIELDKFIWNKKRNYIEKLLGGITNND